MKRRESVLTVVMVLGMIVLYAGSVFAAGSTWLSFDEGLAKAAKEDKAVLIDFYTDWCHWCKVMDEKTFQNDAVAKKLNDRFITVRLNAEDATKSATYRNKTYNNVELTQSFGVTGYPSLAFMDSKGNPITLIPGYVPAETFEKILDYVDQKCYAKNVSFEEFMKNGDCGNSKKK